MAVDLRNRDFDGLLQALIAGQAGSEMFEMAKTMLQVRIMESQSKAAEQMVRWTKVLSIATWALVGATIGLVTSTLVVIFK